MIENKKHLFSVLITSFILFSSQSLPSFSQNKESLAPAPLPALKKITPRTPAKELFGRANSSAKLPPAPIGFYSKGCLAGSEMLPYDGSHWQVMRPSRNRNWGHPSLITFLKKFAQTQSSKSGWLGLLIGDISQSRGGPMLTGHASHQIGLDVDIWLTPMPEYTLSRSERENNSAINMVRPDRLDIDPKVWTKAHVEVLRLAAQQPEVQRIFVNPAIKRALCREPDKNRKWLGKVRPTAGHNYHFHIRLFCPKGATGCTPQNAIPAGDGCGAELDWWFSDAVLNPKPYKGPKRKPLVMSDLPNACQSVLNAEKK